MNDTELRLAKLEGSLRRLRIVCSVLAVALVGAFTMGAAPAGAPKLTASELVLRSDKRTVTITPHAITLDGPDGTTTVEAGKVLVKKDNLEAAMEIANGGMAYVGVAAAMKAGPASSSLRVTNRETQDPSPQLLVSFDGKINAVMTTP